VIVRTEPELTEYTNLSYKGVLGIAIGHLLSGEQFPLVIRRRCCNIVRERTMSVETCNEIRAIAGADKEDEKSNSREIETNLDIAFNNWYLRGRISLIEKDPVRHFSCCRNNK